MRFLFSILALLSLTFVTSSQTQPVHVVIVIGENTNATDADSQAPGIFALGQQYAAAEQYYATTHPSIGNYFAMTDGINETGDDSLCPESFVVSHSNVVRSAIAAGKTWKQYAESIPSVGYLGCSTGDYAAKHTPLPYYSDAQTASQVNNTVPFTQFAKDLAAGALPAYSFVTPNLCSDAHDCSVATFDGWVKTNILPLLSNSQFLTQNGVLIITWDETSDDNTHGGGRVQFVVAGPHIKKAYKSNTLYQHASLCRWSMELIGAPVPAGCASAPSMSEFLATTSQRPAPPTNVTTVVH